MNSKKTKVSVIMPVYNTQENYLREAIESVLHQTFTDFEFIIVNDGSTNNAEEVILSYKDERIRYFKQENQGIAKTTNKMFDFAEGEYIALTDSDDVNLPNRLKLEVDYLDAHPDIGCVSACYREIPSQNEYRVTNRQVEIKYLELLKENIIANGSVLIRKSILDENGLRIDEHFDCAQDYEFWARVVRYTKIVMLPDILYLYRILPNSNSHSNVQHLQEMNQIIKKEMLDFLTEDKELQEKIIMLVGSPLTVSGGQKLKYTFWQRIFSLKNYKKEGKKTKVLTLWGMKFEISKANL